MIILFFWTGQPTWYTAITNMRTQRARLAARARAKTYLQFGLIGFFLLAIQFGLWRLLMQPDVQDNDFLSLKGKNIQSKMQLSFLLTCCFLSFITVLTFSVCLPFFFSSLSVSFLHCFLRFLIYFI